MAGNSSRRGKKGASVGSGGMRRKALEGKGPTPKAEERPGHKAYRAPGRGGSRRQPPGRGPGRRRSPGSDQVAGRNAVLEALSEERSEEHTSELQSRGHLVCRLLLEKKKDNEK